MANETIKLKPVGQKYSVGSGESSPQDENYDPHLHRTVDKPTTNSETLIHMLKGCLGTGILAMPEALKNAGMINGIVCTFLIGFLCTYCLHVLVKTQYILCKRLKVPILTYPESMKVALETGPQCLQKFANMSPLLVDFFLIVYQLGICCVYVLFVAENLRDVINVYVGKDIDLKIYMLALILPFTLINSIRNLKLLAPFSTLANIVTFASFAVVLYYVFQNMPSLSDRPAFGTLYTFPIFFGTTLFALEAVGVVITLENNMKEPKKFGGTFGVLNISMAIIVFLYVGMGFIGYWKYGEDVASSITLNFPQEAILAQSVKVLYSLAIFISYGLQGYVPVDIMWKTYMLKRLEDSNHLLVWEYGLRVTAVLITFILAATIPLLGLFISLFGAFCLSALGLAFPAIMEICVLWPNDLGPFRLILVKDIILIILGIVGLLSGTYSCVSEIIIKLGG